MSNATPNPRSQTSGPLAGSVIVDLTRVLSGPYCTMMLADLGARVIKIELPKFGDDARQIGPFMAGPGETKSSGYFFSINRNKESIALNLKETEDREIFKRLLAKADVLVENFTPGTMKRFGCDWDSLNKTFPKLVMASISGFGQTGPYSGLPAYDMVVQAMGGVMSVTGQDGGEPTRVGISIGDIAAGTFAVIGIQAALLERVRTGRGKHVDISMLDSQVALLENALVRYQVDGIVPGPIGSRHPSITPFGVFKAKAGYLVIAAGNDRGFGHLCDILGLEAVKEDARFASNASRCEHHAALTVALQSALAERTAEQWLTILTEAGIPCGPMNDIAAIMRDPQLRARDMFVALETDGGRSIMTAACPIRFAGEERPDYKRAPTLDEHRSSILEEFGMASTDGPERPR